MLANVWRREINTIVRERKFLFVDDVMVYLENPW